VRTVAQCRARPQRAGRRRASTVAALAGLVALIAVVPAAAQAESFRVSYSPPLSEASAQGNPDSPKTPQRITVTALGDDGRPLHDARIDATVTAPVHGALTGSDVPRAEGRRLVHVELGAPRGQAAFQYVMPIRGSYDLALRATPTAGATFEPFAERRSFTIEERSGELLKFVLVGLGMLLFGAASAFVLVRAKRAGDAAPASRAVTPAHPRGTAALAGVVLLLAAGSVAYLVSAVLKDAREDRRVAALQGPGTGLDRTGRSGPVKLAYHVSRSNQDGIGIQTVVRISGRVTDARTGRPLDGAALHLEALDEESGSPAFTATATAPDGTFAWDQTFWDGVDYEVNVEAAAPGSDVEPASAHAKLAVDAMSPPVDRKLLALLLLLLPLVLGMGGGALLARRTTSRRDRRSGVDARTSMPAIGG
jgi:hypothetical protein